MPLSKTIEKTKRFWLVMLYYRVVEAVLKSTSEVRRCSKLPSCPRSLQHSLNLSKLYFSSRNKWSNFSSPSQGEGQRFSEVSSDYLRSRLWMQLIQGKQTECFNKSKKMSCDGTLNCWKHLIKDTGHLISTIDKTD